MEEKIIYETNEFQTKITEEFINSYPKEVVEEFWDYVNNVPYIQNLISPNRRRAKDMPKDADGKIIIDFTNPHIIENMDYFRESALHFEKYGRYTDLRVNTHPRSEFMKWFKRELRRCWYGMVRPEDGEWITGDFYYYLNYSIMKRTVKVTLRDGRTINTRKEGIPSPWEGVYLRFHYLNNAKLIQMHGAEISSRGKSKSYTIASLVTKMTLLGISEELCNKRASLIVASNKDYLIKKGQGVFEKFEHNVDHAKKFTQFPSAFSQNSLTNMTWTLGSETLDGQLAGPQNTLAGSSIADNPEKSRGGRVDLMCVDEFGVFPKFMEWWGSAMPNVQEGEEVFGLSFKTGTGGTTGADFIGALDMIDSPKSQNVLGIPNVFDKGSTGKKDSIFFYPAYLNYAPYYNKDGVSDVVGAMFSELNQRYEIKYNSSDPTKVTQRRAEFAFTLQDAIMKTSSTIYPVADLTDRIQYIDNNPYEIQSMYVGELEIEKGEVVWKPNAELFPILAFPHKDNKAKGAVYIKEHPIKDSTGKVPDGRYISGADTIETDGAETLSLFSSYILDLWTDEIVAEYTGREPFTDDSFEIYRRLLMYYNAIGNYESNKKGLFAHFSKFNSLHLLSDTLEYLREKDPTRQRYGNASKGTVASEPVKRVGRIMIRNYLLKPCTTTYIKEDENGTEVEVTNTVPMLHTIKFRALLQELSMHNLEGNFDRHDALLMLMLLREENLRLLGDETFENRYKSNSKDYLGDDPFFSTNFKSDTNEVDLEFLNKLKYMGVIN